MGTKVTVLQRSDRIILKRSQKSLRLYAVLENEGIEIKTGVQVKRVYQTQGERL